MKSNLERKRAEYALGRIRLRSKVLLKDKKRKERYLNRVKSLPSTIIMCGLGQTVATLISVEESQDYNPDQMLYKDLEDWLCKERQSVIYQGNDLMVEIVQSDRKKYIQAQAETLKLLEWLKKFAIAYLVEEVINNEEASSL